MTTTVFNTKTSGVENKIPDTSSFVTTTSLNIKIREVENKIPSIPKNIFACLFSIRNTISLSCHEKVCLSGLRFERYFSHHRTYLRKYADLYGNNKTYG